MVDIFDNPMGLCGFEFVEFAAPQAGLIEPLLVKMGFTGTNWNLAPYSTPGGMG